MELTAGRTYRIDMKGLDSDDGDLADPWIIGLGVDKPSDEFYSGHPSGISGTNNWDGGQGRNARLIYTASETRTFYLDVSGEQETTGDYAVELTDISNLYSVTEDDYAADTSTTGILTVGEPATARINHRLDRAWFQVELVAGTVYVIDMEGADTEGGTLQAASLGDGLKQTVFDASGNAVTLSKAGCSTASRSQSSPPPMAGLSRPPGPAKVL